MKILEHPESHIVKLDDGSTWQIFPGDIDQTLSWMPTTELRLFEVNDVVASHALINSDDGTHVRVRPQGEPWPAAKVKLILSGRQAMGFIIQSVSTRASEPPYRITQATKKLRSMRQSD